MVKGLVSIRPDQQCLNLTSETNSLRFALSAFWAVRGRVLWPGYLAPPWDIREAGYQRLVYHSF